MARRAQARAEPGRPATKSRRRGERGARPSTRVPREPRAPRPDRSLDPARGRLHPTQRLLRELHYLRHEPGAIPPQEAPAPERKDGSQEKIGRASCRERGEKQGVEGG